MAVNEQQELDMTEVDDFVLVDGDLDDCKSHATRPELVFRFVLCALRCPPWLRLLPCEPTFEVWIPGDFSDCTDTQELQRNNYPKSDQINALKLEAKYEARRKPIKQRERRGPSMRRVKFHTCSALIEWLRMRARYCTVLRERCMLMGCLWQAHSIHQPRRWCEPSACGHATQHMHASPRCSR